jgi:hypothetical protein
MCDCGFVVIMTFTFLAMGLMSGGIVVLSQADGSGQEFNIPFRDYTEARCVVLDFKVVVDTSNIGFDSCDSEGDFCERVTFFVGVASVRVVADRAVALYAAVVQRPPPGSVSVRNEDMALNATFGPDGAFPVEIGDRVVCGVSSGTRALFGDVNKVPFDGVVALAFNKELAESAWLPLENRFIAGGCMLAFAFVIGILVIIGVICYCREPKIYSGIDRRNQHLRRQRDFVEGTLSRNTCEYGCIDWCGYCCFTMSGGSFE